MTTFTAVLPRPNLERVFVVAGGPSLKGQALEQLYKRPGLGVFVNKTEYILGVNRAFDGVACDGIFTMDRQLYNELVGDGTYEDLLYCGAEIFVCTQAIGEHWPAVPGVKYLERVQGTGYNPNPAQIHNGLNSGWGAVHLALHMRPQEVVLLGFDLLPVTQDQPLHWWDEDASAPRQGMTYYQRWADRFTELELTRPPETRIVNANPNSAIRCFPFTSYEEYGL